MPKPPAKSDIRHDARERFERAVDIAAQTKPMHRQKPKSNRAKRAIAKGRKKA